MLALFNMADKNNKFKENKPGPYYVDKECIACDACVMTAPDHFGMDEDDGHAFVISQPKTEAEQQLCEEALDGCPVEAIGNNGDGSNNGAFGPLIPHNK